MIQKVNKGDIWYYDFGLTFSNHLEAKNRPVVIVSNDIGNRHSSVCTVAPITTRPKSSCQPYQVFTTGLNGKDNIILLEQCQTVSISKLTNYSGRVDKKTLEYINRALAIEFGLEVNADLIVDEFILRMTDKLDVAIKEKMNIINVSNQSEEILNILNNFKKTFNDNSDNMNIMAQALIDLFKQVSDQSQISKSTSKDDIKKSSKINDKPIKTIKNKNVKNSKKSSIKRYDENYCLQFLNDYYLIGYDACFNKYGLSNMAQLTNRRTHATKCLAKLGYNIKDLCKQIKANEFNIDINKSNDTTNAINKPKRSSGRQKMPKEVEIKNGLDFINMYNRYENDELASMLNIEKETVSSKKYRVTKMLKSYGVEFTVMNKRTGEMEIYNKGEGI